MLFQNIQIKNKIRMEKKMLQWYGEQIDIIDNLYEFLSKREDDEEILEFIWENRAK